MKIKITEELLLTKNELDLLIKSQDLLCDIWAKSPLQSDIREITNNLIDNLDELLEVYLSDE